MSMRIVKNGDVHVSVPIGYPRKLVEDFIAEHADWIESARKRNAERVKGQNDFFSKLPLQTKAQAYDAIDRLDAIITPMVEIQLKKRILSIDILRIIKVELSPVSIGREIKTASSLIIVTARLCLNPLRQRPEEYLSST